MAFQLSFAVYITSVKTPSYSDIHLKYRKNLQGFHFLANGVLESQAMWPQVAQAHYESPEQHYPT